MPFLLRRLLISIAVLSFFYVFFVPMPCVCLRFGCEELNISKTASLGTSWETRYVHSLELTEVEDVYIFVDKKIWLWEERVKSHNAGLPTETNRSGFFKSDREWMRFFGGRFSAKELTVRIGDESLGKNQFRFPPGDWLSVFDLCPNSRCEVSMSCRPIVLSWMGI